MCYALVLARLDVLHNYMLVITLLKYVAVSRVQGDLFAIKLDKDTFY